MSVKKQKKTWKKFAQMGLWSDYCALKSASDQTCVRLKLPLIRPSQTKVTSDQTVPDQNDLWSGKFQTIVQTKVRSKLFPDHVIRAHREQVCGRRWSDQRSLWSGHLDLGNTGPPVRDPGPSGPYLSWVEDFILDSLEHRENDQK